MKALFCLLFAFLLQVAAQDCTGRGVVQRGYCNCFSGYAPDYSNAYTNCHVTPSGFTASDDDLTTGYAKPRITATNSYQFVKDRLVVSILMDVQDISSSSYARLTTNIDFYQGGSAAVAASSSCSYPGALWKKFIIGTTESYQLSMPWPNNGLCGFTQDVTPSYVFYTATLKVSYLVYIGAGSVNRTVTNLYTVRVRLARQALLQATIAVSLDSPSSVALASVVVRSSSYDIGGQRTSVVFQTSTPWPYQIASPRTTPATTGPISTNATIVILPDYTTTDNCATAGSPCIQQFVAIINSSAANCDPYGSYSFTTQLVCTDVTTCTPIAGQNIMITVDHSAVCSPVVAYPNRLAVTSLTPYTDSAFLNQQSDYQTGDVIYWQFAVTDPSITIDALTLEYIIVTTPTGTDTPYISGALNTTTGAPDYSQAVYNVSTVSGTFAPGTEIPISFRLSLSRKYLPNTVGMLDPSTVATQSVQLSVQVGVRVKYHGNARRTVSIVSPLNRERVSSVHTIYLRTPLVNQDSINTSTHHGAEETTTSSCAGNAVTCAVIAAMWRMLNVIGF